MASGFSGSQEGRCEGLGCKSASGLEYYVKEKKTLCEDCANKTVSARKVKKNELAIVCEEHDMPIKLYCQSHEEALCQICAIKDHQKPCQLENIKAVLANRRSQILNLKATLLEKQLLWKGYGNKVCKCREESEAYIKSVERDIIHVVDEELLKNRDKERHAEKLINDEADEKIRKMTEEINQEREARLKQCHEPAKANRQQIQKRRCELLDDVASITDKLETKIDDLQRNARNMVQCLDEAAESVETLLENDKKLLKGAQQLITSLTDTLEKTADEGVVDHITRTVEGVRFIEGKGNMKYNGRIGGYDGKWELSDTAVIPVDIIYPVIVGYTSSNELIVSDKEKEHTYCFNVKNKLSQRVITSDGQTRIVSCALLDEDMIVCGKLMRGCTGSSLPGCISLYNRHWELIRDVTLPNEAFSENTGKDESLVYVAVTQDGMVIAAQCSYHCLYVIDPNNGCIINTIRCKMWIGNVWGVLATGDVIAKHSLFDNQLFIINMQGIERTIIHEFITNCGIDPLTDDLYVGDLDYERKHCKGAVIDQISEKGDQDRREVISYPMHTGFVDDVQTFLMNSRPVITASGDFVLCNGRECLVFKKRFTL